MIWIECVHWVWIDYWDEGWKNQSKNHPFSPFLKCWFFIFKFYHSKNMNKNLKFEHNMHNSKTHWIKSKSTVSIPLTTLSEGRMGARSSSVTVSILAVSTWDADAMAALSDFRSCCDVILPAAASSPEGFLSPPAADDRCPIRLPATDAMSTLTSSSIISTTTAACIGAKKVISSCASWYHEVSKLEKKMKI